MMGAVVGNKELIQFEVHGEPFMRSEDEWTLIR